MFHISWHRLRYSRSIVRQVPTPTDFNCESAWKAHAATSSANALAWRVHGYMRDRRNPSIALRRGSSRI